MTAPDPASRVDYRKAQERQGTVLALLAEHPGGLSQIDLAALTGWSSGMTSGCMAALEQSGQVCVTGGTAGHVAKTYRLATAGNIEAQPGRCTREAQILALLTEHAAGLSQGVLASALGMSQTNVRNHLSHLGLAIHSRKQGRHTIVSLSAAELEHRCAVELVMPSAPQQPVTRTQSHSYPTQPLTGELGAARKLLAGLNSKTARALACAGNYRYGRAEELFGQLQMLGYVS